jgi:hypothetical protein
VQRRGAGLALWDLEAFLEPGIWVLGFPQRLALRLVEHLWPYGVEDCEDLTTKL